jgi:serine/threonine protein kinase
MPIETGQTLGDYEVIDLLESSKTCVTYKVRNVLLQRIEALRVLPRSFQDDQERVTRFMREAKLHARISHPNIVTFYHATQLDGQLVMTTELVEGTTLAQRLELGPLSSEEAVSCFSQVLSGLAQAHALGVVHRDITPSNIILASDGRVKVTGFALAKATTDPQLTQPGTVIGSLDYISPEQVKGLGEVDARTDIYSLGVVLYEAVTGRKPFEEKSQFEVMLAHVNSIPLAPSIVNPEVPAELSDIVLKAMAKHPAARFQTAEEFRQSLEQLCASPETRCTPIVEAAQVGEPEIAVTPLSGAEDFDSSMPGQPWNSWSLWAAGLFIFLVFTWAFFVVLRRF